MNDFRLQRKQKIVLAALALTASVVGLFVDAKGFLVDSLSAVVGFSAALMLAGPIVRSFKRETQMAAADYVGGCRFGFSGQPYGDLKNGGARWSPFLRVGFTHRCDFRVA